MNFVEELRWRGMLQDIMPGTEELLNKEQVTAYLGIDPTADSLHIGHLCGVMILRHLQRCGHKPLALIGGATGMIGDPSGKSAERNLLNEETLRHNQACIKKQLAKFLDFESDVPNRAELVNNYDWMKEFSFLDFVREVGKHITVNYMMAKDSVKRRLNGEARDGLSFTEFTYQLLQGYDFLHLYETKGCKLQMGGSDQWGNITTGAELIRRTNGGEVFALTCPLITKADGGKFGKTEPQFEISRDALAEGVKAVDLFVDNAAVFASKGEMRKLVQGGGVSLNKEKLEAFDQVITTADLLDGKYLLVQRGKKNYFLLIAK